MAGYDTPSRHQPAQGVLHDIYAKAMAFEDPQGQRALMISAELCVLRPTQIEAFCQQITQATGLQRSQILLNLSHTHSGPFIGLEDADMGPLPIEQRRSLAAYTQTLQQDLVDISVAALADLQPSQLSYGVGSADFVVNRRIINANGTYVGMGPNPNGYKDDDVPVLRVDRPDGTLRAVLFGTACHNVALGANLEVSGDYAGVAQIQLEQQYPGVQAMFMTGCGADANPEPRSSVALTTQHGTSLAASVSQVLQGTLQAVKGPIRTELDWVDLPLTPVPSQAELEQLAAGPVWDSYTAGHMLEALGQGQTLPTHYSAPIAFWQFGQDLSLVALPGETVSDYVRLTQKMLGKEKLWMSGYNNDVFGYLPSVKILSEGGYEARGLFGPDIGWFAPQVEDTVMDKIGTMAERVGRPLAPVEPDDTRRVAYWRFEPGQTMADSSGNGITLVANHGATFVEDSPPGKPSQGCTAMNGSSYIDAGNPAGLNGEWDGLTVTAWIKPDSNCLTGARMIAGKWAFEESGDHFGLFLFDGKPLVAVGDGQTGEGGLVGLTVLEADEWHFVVGTWDADTCEYRIYIDGQLDAVGFQIGNGINAASSKELIIGAQMTPGTERYFSGHIDEISIFDGKLDQQAIKVMFAGPAPGDANWDGRVDDTDAIILAANWQSSGPEIGWQQGDFNGDGKVDDRDATMLAVNWQEGVAAGQATVPEPTMAGILSLSLIWIVVLQSLIRN